MKKSFKDALEKGLVEPSTLSDGSPFVVDGVQYYQATQEGVNMLVGRFHAFGDTLRKHDELKLTGALLETGFAGLKLMLKRIRSQALTDTEQVLDSVQESLLIIDRLEQRQTIGLSLEQTYEIASIFHFSEDEDPGSVDWSINKKKISSWLKDERAGLFFYSFLNSPIGNYIPLVSLSDTNMLSFLKETNISEILDWTRTLLQLKTNGESPATMSTIESRRETLYGYDSLLSVLSKPTSITGQPGSGPNSEK